MNEKNSKIKDRDYTQCDKAEALLLKYLWSVLVLFCFHIRTFWFLVEFPGWVACQRDMSWATEAERVGIS